MRILITREGVTTELHAGDTLAELVWVLADQWDQLQCSHISIVRDPRVHPPQADPAANLKAPPL